MAAINCSLNARELPAGLTLQPTPGLGNLAVFEHFLPQLQGKKVVVIGRYPGIERYAEQIDLHIIERQAMESRALTKPIFSNCVQLGCCIAASPISAGRAS